MRHGNTNLYLNRPPNFNPRTREGCDLPRKKIKRSESNFNPRTREGCDPLEQVSHQKNQNFNPRTREGCDIMLNLVMQYLKISIHAPAKGATKRPVNIYMTAWISIHAPAKGATRTKNENNCINNDFNPRTREGCDE